MFNPQDSQQPQFGGNMFNIQAPSWHGRFPWTPNFHFPNNPAASATLPQTQKADVGGIQQAMQKRSAQDNSAERISATGEKSGVTFKHDNEGHATGQDAFATLDGYMKKAGLNSFQRQFFTKLIEDGLDQNQIQACVKKAGDQFGEKVAEELNSGFEKLAFMSVLRTVGGLGLKGLSKVAPKLTSFGTEAVGKHGLREGLKRTASQAGSQLRQQGAAAVDTVKNLASRQGLKDFGQGFSGKGYPRMNSAVRTGQNVGNFLKGKGARGQLTQGALTGAVNPYTGMHTWHDDEGNFSYRKALMSLGGGAALSRLGGNPLMGAQRRALVGEGVGAGIGLGGQALGFDVDPNTFARAGFLGGGIAPRNLRGLIPKNLYQGLSPGMQSLANKPLVTSAGKGLLDKVDPFGNLYRVGAKGVQKAAPWIKNNPGQAAMIGGGLAAGAGGIAAPIVAGNVAAKGVKQMQDGLMPLAEYATETMGNVNRAVNNPLGTLLGGAGQYLQQNPMMALALLGGLGATGGGMMGGGTGATLGGIGLPLAYMLASGQNPMSMLQGHQTPQYGVQNQQALGPAMQNLPSRNESLKPEVQRQQEMQQAAMQGISQQATGQGVGIEQLLSKASPEQLQALQNPNLPDEIKNQIIQELYAA